MWLRSDNFEDGQAIPGKNALCVPAEEGHATFSANTNPHLEWGDAPEGTKSFALLCIDVAAPSVRDDVNQEDREVPEDLPRTDFTHWLLVDIPADTTEIKEGSFSDGVTTGGKAQRTGRPADGINDYTGWFEDDPEMAGTYHGYDGPCPPWNDSIIHHYEFRLFALDVEALGQEGEFTAFDVENAVEGHVLDGVVLTGTYTLNPRLRST